MKEVYISPEIKLLGFAPAERLANDMDVILDGTTSSDKVSGVISGIDDIDFEL